MRSLGLFIVLIAAFFLLLTDRNGKSGSGKIKTKVDPTVEATTETGGDSMESLSDEYKPQDLSRYSNIKKLKEDFDYRSSKLDFQLEAEIKEFIKDHDRYGKDEEAYKKILKRHSKLRSEFQSNRKQTLQYYKDTTSEGPKNTELR